jgi:hypothetical protein
MSEEQAKRFSDIASEPVVLMTFVARYRIISRYAINEQLSILECTTHLGRIYVDD